MPDPIHWLDVEEIAIRLHETYPDHDPLSVRFTELRRMVESLPEFREEPGHPVNEKILETIQAMWHEEKAGAQADDESD